MLRRGIESQDEKNVFIEFGEAFTDDMFMIEGRMEAHIIYDAGMMYLTTRLASKKEPALTTGYQ